MSQEGRWGCKAGGEVGSPKEAGRRAGLHESWSHYPEWVLSHFVTAQWNEPFLSPTEEVGPPRGDVLPARSTTVVDGDIWSSAAVPPRADLAKKFRTKIDRSAAEIVHLDDFIRTNAKALSKLAEKFERSLGRRGVVGILETMRRDTDFFGGRNGEALVAEALVLLSML